MRGRPEGKICPGYGFSRNSWGDSHWPVKLQLLGQPGNITSYFNCSGAGLSRQSRASGVPMADIIVTDGVGERLFAIQVKTRREKGTDRGWHMRDKHETIRSPSLFYCFVDVGKALVDVPFCYVVPSDVVAKCLKETYREWLAAPEKRASPIRTIPCAALSQILASMGQAATAKGGSQTIAKRGTF